MHMKISFRCFNSYGLFSASEPIGLEVDCYLLLTLVEDCLYVTLFQKLYLKAKLNPP